MKEVRSFFEAPSNYLYSFLLGIGSFSGLLFWFIENGLAYREPVYIFNVFIGIFLGIPTIIPFYHLIISGRNSPKLIFFIIPLVGVTVAMLFIYDTRIFATSITIWILSFFYMLGKGKSIKLTSDDTIWMRENAIIEVLLITVSLLVILSLMTYPSREYLIANPNVNKAFIAYSKGIHLKSDIDNKNKLIKLEQKIYRDGDKYEFMFNDFKEMNTILNSDSFVARNHQNLPYVLDPISFKKVQYEIRAKSIIFQKTQEIFADRFFIVLRHFQVKGIILLLISSLMLLSIWIFCMEKEELSNRARAHFFVLLLLIVPILRKFELKDITIEKPFGFSFSDGKAADRHIEMMLDSIAKRQLFVEGRVDNVRENVDKVENKVFERVNGILMDEDYIQLVDAVRENMPSEKKREYKENLADRQKNRK